jgi:dimethylhistidine N-methyltransferase
VAIHRDPFSTRPLVNEKSTAIVSAAAKENFRDEVLAGLSKSPRQLPYKFFYDQRGAQLFQQICDLPEYYVTRTEIEILRLHGAEMARALGPQIELIGLGTGAGTKTRILLEELRDPAVYVPIDISKEQLEKSSARFREMFPTLQVLPVAADYLEPFELPLPRRLSSRSVIYFPGSTIGNFEPEAASEFLARMVELAGDGGGLLIGVDLQKDRDVLERAYNDPAGVTAQFNKNLLARINRELAADFDLKRWQHHAIYNSTEGRIEIYLISESEQTVHIDEHEFQFRAGEEILTEYSYKHTIAGFNELARQAGFHFEQVWTDDARWFGVFYFTVAV